MSDRARRLLLVAALAAVWGASLAVPALQVAGGPLLRGVDVLLEGWKAGSHGVIAWYANPVLAAALLLAALGGDAAAAVLSGLALLLALSSFALEPILALQMPRVPAVTLLPGFFVWLAAIVALFVWSAERALCRKRRLRRSAGTESASRD